MYVRQLEGCREFVAGDHSILRELLHPDKQSLKIRYSLAHARVGPGQSTKPHKLASSEVYYILAGEGTMHIDHQSCSVGPDCAIYIPPESVQYIENTADCDLVFLCIVDPAWREEDEEILDGGGSGA
jgi:mannose-6-phosphate isomerase-like protein (cupin superfamily)